MAVLKTAARFSQEWKRHFLNILMRMLGRLARTHGRTNWTSTVCLGTGKTSAIVRHVNSAGAVAKVELVLVDQETAVQVSLSRERYLELQLHQGDAVFVVPRQLRIFIADDWS